MSQYLDSTIRADRSFKGRNKNISFDTKKRKFQNVVSEDRRKKGTIVGVDG